MFNYSFFLHKSTQGPITEDDLEGVEVVADKGFQNVCNGIEPGFPHILMIVDVLSERKLVSTKRR